MKDATKFFVNKTIPKFTEIIVEDINLFDETELWIQIAALVNEKTNLIFTGDPTIRSPTYFLNLPFNLLHPKQSVFDRYAQNGYLKDM